MKKNISYIHNCYGCGVCTAVCKKNIITLKLNNQGFYTPQITNSSLCTNCGLCLEVCSFNSSKIASPENSPLKSYAAWSNDEKTRKECSSGGIGFEIAKFLIENKYKACLVKYNTESNRAEHYIANKISDLPPSKGSKYIQSYTEKAFKAIDLKEKYLITGTPCQIDSIRKYLKKFRKEDNFVLMDFFCHGVPSMKIWERYKRNIEQKISISNVAWRNKNTNWHDSWVIHIEGKKKILSSIKESPKNTINYNYYSKATEGDLFYQLYFRNACLNKACYAKCKYKYDSSSADIRIGDLWGETYKNNNEGVSALIGFTDKGVEIIKNISNNVTLIEHPFKTVAEGQIKNKLKEPWYIRHLILNLIACKTIPLNIIVLIMKICLKLSNSITKHD